MSSTRPLYVGLVTLLLICITTVLIIWQSDILRKISGYELVGRFDNIAGLIKGADIRYRGYSVGRVTHIQPTPQHIDVRFWVNGSVDIPRGSHIKILFDGLVGENYIGIDANQKSPLMVSEGDVLDGTSGSDLANFIDLGSQNLIHTEAILNNLRVLLTDETLFKNIAQSINNIQSATAKFALLTSEIDTSNAKQLKTVVDNLEQITTRLAEPEFMNALASSNINIQRISSDLAAATSSSKSLLSEQNVQRLSEAIENISELTAKLNEFVTPSKKKKPHILTTLSSLSFSNETGVYSSSSRETEFYNSDFELGLGAYSLILGLGDYSGEDQLQHFQQAYLLNSRLRSRVGIFYNEPGFGLDYYLTERLTFGVDYYNFSEGYLSFSTAIRVYQQLHLHTMIRNDNANRDSDVNVGMKVSF